MTAVETLLALLRIYWHFNSVQIENAHKNMWMVTLLLTHFIIDLIKLLYQYIKWGDFK